MRTATGETSTVKNSNRSASARQTRRQFLATLPTVAAGVGALPFVFTAARGAEGKPRSPNERPRVGAIGMRYQGTVIGKKAELYGDVVAVCDVDQQILEKAKSDFGGKVDTYEDYHDLLARSDIDIVTIGAPDHWHTSMCVDACRAGKDVYCEKPLTLTIDEGKHLVKVVRATERVLQVGSWQRSDHNFRLACEMARSGRLGKLRRIEVVLGKNKTGGPFEVQPVPKHLNWNLWQGQTPDVPYIPERSHYTFRWWYEYAGGQMTDWGAHHVDIAQWAAGYDRSGPVEIETRATFPQVENGYNVATFFEATYRYQNGVVVTVKDDGRSGLLIEGDAGRIFVNRGGIEGKPVEELAGRPFAREDFRLYAHDNLDRPPRSGKLDAIINHMGNFFDCVHGRKVPICDVESQHRSATACHLANISMRLGRPLKWDPERELFVGDDEANRWLRRDQRAGFEIPS